MPGPEEKKLIKAAKRERRRQKREKKKQKNFFVRGLVVLLPTVLTIFIFATVVQFVNTYLTKPINATILTVLDSNAIGWQALEMMDVDPRSKVFLDLEGLPMSLQDRIGPGRELGSVDCPKPPPPSRTIATSATPSSATSTASRSTAPSCGARSPSPGGSGSSARPSSSCSWLPRQRLPGPLADHRLRQGADADPSGPVRLPLHQAARRLFLSDSELEFDTVVAAPYPSEGVWAIGFVTGGGLKTVHESPTAPTCRSSSPPRRCR